MMIFFHFTRLIIYLYQFIRESESMQEDIYKSWGGQPSQKRNRIAVQKIFPEVKNNPIDLSSPIYLHQRRLDYCVICRSRPANGFLMQCEHRNLCLVCAEEIVLSDIQRNKDSVCPIEHCKKTISKKKESFLFKFSSQTKKKWVVYQYKKTLSSPWNIHNCQKPNCQGVLNPQSLQCILCKEKHCPKCFRLAHEDKCLLISHNLIGVNDLKPCKNCKYSIYKDGGCAKIICPNCKEQLCYECMDQWEFKHYGCSEYGWLSPIYFFFLEKCSGKKDNQYQIIVDSAQRMQPQ